MPTSENISIYPSEISEWIRLVADAQSKQSTYLCETLENYVVFLLIRFSNKPEMLSKVMGLEILEPVSPSGKVLENKLKDIGDTCLIFTGLYPDIARKRNVTNEYYISIGKTAYSTLSNHNNNDNYMEVYKLLCQEFISITNVLKGMRGINNNELNHL